MIPRLFHFVWITPPKKTPNMIRLIADLDEPKQQLIENWQRLHPDFHIKLWTDKEGTDLLRQYPKWQAIFDRCMDVGCRSDILRYLILKTEGGVYLDTDVMATKACDELIAFMEGIPQEVAFPSTDVGLLSNYIIISKTNSAVWDKCLEEMTASMGVKKGVKKPKSIKRFLSKLTHQLKTLEQTGPWMIDKLYQKNPDLVYKLPVEYSGTCFSKSCVEREKRKTTVFFVHTHEGSWHPHTSRWFSASRSLLQGEKPSTVEGAILAAIAVVLVGAFSLLLIWALKNRNKKTAADFPFLSKNENRRRRRQ